MHVQKVCHIGMTLLLTLYIESVSDLLFHMMSKWYYRILSWLKENVIGISVFDPTHCFLFNLPKPFHLSLYGASLLNILISIWPVNTAVHFKTHIFSSANVQLTKKIYIQGKINVELLFLFISSCLPEELHSIDCNRIHSSSEQYAPWLFQRRYKNKSLAENGMTY